jgi:hypothetical protein
VDTPGPHAHLAAQSAIPVRRLAAWALLVLVAATVVWRAAPAVRWATTEADSTRGMSRADRELAGARAVDLDPRPFLRAAELIARDETFYVSIADGFPFTYEVSRFSAPGFATYWLQPRRWASEPGEADWIISYGSRPEELALDVEMTFDVGGGVTLLRVRR